MDTDEAACRLAAAHDPSRDPGVDREPGAPSRPAERRRGYQRKTWIRLL